jgi:hypothetical protein
MVPLEVRLREGRPERVRWQEPGAARAQVDRVVEVLDDWDYAGRWWDQEIRRHYLLLETERGRTLEVFREGDDWCLSRLSD